jgi:tripartite-type tricarboxylate transporter receptor subunit TctC
MPARDLSELIAWLKAHPNQASVGGNNLAFRLVAARFQNQTGTQFTFVPYRAAGSVLGDLVAGQIDLSFNTQVVSPPLVRSESIKAYAVTGETARHWRPTSRLLPKWDCLS